MEDKGHFRWECLCGTYVYEGTIMGPIDLDEVTEFIKEARSKGHKTAGGECCGLEADQV